MQLLAPSLALGVTFPSLCFSCTSLPSFTIFFCSAKNILIVLGKKRYIFFDFWASQVRSGLCPSVLVLLCPVVALLEQYVNTYTLVKVLFPCLTVYSVKWGVQRGWWLSPSMVSLLEGGPVAQATQNERYVSLYEGTLLGGMRLMWLQVYPSVNLILHSSVQCCLHAWHICSSGGGGKKSMLTDKEAQDIVGTMIAESI